MRFWGKVSIANVFDMMEQVGADPRFDRLRYILADYREVMEQNVTEREVDEIAALGYAHSLTNPRYLHAAVATDERIISLLQHWKASVVQPEQVGHFTSLEQAREWIHQHTY